MLRATGASRVEVEWEALAEQADGGVAGGEEKGEKRVEGLRPGLPWEIRPRAQQSGEGTHEADVLVLQEIEVVHLEEGANWIVEVEARILLRQQNRSFIDKGQHITERREVGFGGVVDIEWFGNVEQLQDLCESRGKPRDEEHHGVADEKI